MGLIIGVFIALAVLTGDCVYTIVSSDKDKWVKALGLALLAIALFCGLVLPCIL